MCRADLPKANPPTRRLEGRITLTLIRPTGWTAARAEKQFLERFAKLCP
jgi:hypothetical protein